MKSERKQAEALQLRGDRLRNNGKGLEAAAAYKKAAELFERVKDRKAVAECWHMMGVSYNVENDTAAALKTLEHAALLHQKAGNAAGMGRAYRDIGIAFAYRKKRRLALSWLMKSEKALRRCKDQAELGITEAKIGLQYLKAKDYRKAEKWLEKGLRTIRKMHHWFYEMTALLNLAELRFAQKQYAAMITALWAGVGLIVEAGASNAQERRLAQLYGLLAQGYLAAGNTETGATLCRKALRLLAGMKENVRAVVFEDIRISRFLRALKKRDSKQYARLTKEFGKILPR